MSGWLISLVHLIVILSHMGFGAQQMCLLMCPLRLNAALSVHTMFQLKRDGPRMHAICCCKDSFVCRHATSYNWMTCLHNKPWSAEHEWCCKKKPLVIGTNQLTGVLILCQNTFAKYKNKYNKTTLFQHAGLFIVEYLVRHYHNQSTELEKTWLVWNFLSLLQNQLNFVNNVLHVSKYHFCPQVKLQTSLVSLHEARHSLSLHVLIAEEESSCLHWTVSEHIHPWSELFHFP